MTLDTRPLTSSFGVEASGIDLAAPMDDADFAALRTAFVDAGVMLVRDQGHLTPEDHVRFSARFGPLENHVLAQLTLPCHPEIFVVSNIVENGRHIGAHGGSKQYHSDLAYLAKPSLGSIFHCLECPNEGGERRSSAWLPLMMRCRRLCGTDWRGWMLNMTMLGVMISAMPHRAARYR